MSLDDWQTEQRINRDQTKATLRTNPQRCFNHFLGDWPLPTIGGRLHLARNPNQGIFCSRDQKTLKNNFGPSGDIPGYPRHPEGCFSVCSYKRQRLEALIGTPSPGREMNYFSSALAPASTNFFRAASASALAMPSLTFLGAPSTKSLASFRPRPVISRTALMTDTF